MSYSARSSARLRHPLPLLRRCAWAICPFLLLSLTGCGTPAPIRAPIDPPPAGLAALCWAGPAWPAGEATLGQLVEVMLQREAAAADCRARHAALVRAWPGQGE